jgi:hypothetical protein
LHSAIVADNPHLPSPIINIRLTGNDGIAIVTQMHFVWFIASLLVYTLLFFGISKLSRNGTGFTDLLAIVLFVPLYSIGVAALTSRYALSVSYSWVYFLIGAVLCFNVNGVTVLFRDEAIRPRGHLVITFSSVLSYIIAALFMYKSGGTITVNLIILVIVLIFGFIAKLSR